MLWGTITLILAGSFALGVSFYLNRESGRLKFLGLLLASGVFIVAEVAFLLSGVITGNTATYITNLIIEWGHVYSIALVLCSLLLFVRESKPEFSQFPLLYCALPILTIAAYLLVHNTLMLKYWLINIYQGGAVVVALMMYGIYSYRDSIYSTLTVGSVLFIVSFLIYLFFYEWMMLWQIFLAVAIFTTFSGYLVVERHYTN